jgi:hypothetical protein
MNAVEKTVENVNVVEKKVLENGKAENGQNGQKANKKNNMEIAKLIMQRIEALDIDLSEISELNQLAKEIVELNLKIQKLSEERLQKMNKAKEIMEKLNSDSIRLLEFLGLLNTEEIERAIGKASITKVQTIERTERAEKGNGLSGKKIVFQGKMYNIANYFAQKHGIKGGLRGLEEWAKQKGFSVKIEDDVIFIV